MILRSPSLPDRSPVNPLASPAVDVFQARPRTYVPRRGVPYGFGYGVGYGYPFDVYAPSASVASQPVPAGYLQLDVQPATAQVYVDGMFMGSVDDFRRMIPGRMLEAGAHRVELRAPRHETVAFDVNVPSSGTITYRHELDARTAATPVPAAPVVQAVPKTFYVIPGCYAGDKPPRRGTLPAGCDLARLRKVPPQVSVVSSARGR